MSRIFAPSPSVHVARTPIYLRGGLGQDDGGGDYSSYDYSSYDYSAPDYSSYDYSSGYDVYGGAAPQVDVTPSDIASQISYPSDVAAPQDALDAALTASDLTAEQANAVYDVLANGGDFGAAAAAAGISVTDVLSAVSGQPITNVASAPEVSLSPIASQLPMPAPYSPLTTTFYQPPAPSGGASRSFSPGGGSSGGGGGKSSGSMPQQAPKPLLPNVPAPAPRIAYNPNAVNTRNPLTSSTLIAGIPNWAIAAAALLGVFAFSGPSSAEPAPARRKK